MAILGQVVYNLFDQNAGGYISTSAQDKNTTIISTQTGYEQNRFDIFESDIVGAFTDTTRGFQKIGIQAPPGTKVKINGNKIIMVGRNGVYELDEGIAITGLTFVRPRKYVIDKVRTEQNLIEGQNGFRVAEAARQLAITALNGAYMRRRQDYLDEYASIKTFVGNAEWDALDAEYENQDLDQTYWARYIDIRADIPELLTLDTQYDRIINTDKDEYYWSLYTDIQDAYQEQYDKALAKYVVGVNGIYVAPSTLDPMADDYDEVYNVIIDFLY